MTLRSAYLAVAVVLIWAAPAVAGQRVVLPADVAPIHYEIAVVPDSARLTLSGQVTIDLDVAKATRTISLNAADLTFGRVRLEGEAEEPKVTFDEASQTATFTFANEIAPGRHKLSIDYAGKIYQQASGLFALDYKAGKRQKRALFTQFENSDARRFVPCWDEPNRKATFALTVTVPRRDLAVSNMPVASSVRAGRGMKRVRFATSPKMSSYLLFLSSDDMERVSRRVGKVDLGIVVKRGDRARARYALAAAAQILPYYDDYFGVAYPLPKLDFIAGPGSSQFFGAMENWGAIFYFERAILVDPKTTTERDRRRIFAVIAHEMAHQWFGDLVTMDWWDDLWLNEGFATWMAFKASDHFHPEWSVLLDMIGSKDRAMGRDGRVGTHPIVQPILDVLQASQAFDSITYQKGGAVIRMLEDYVGEKAFREGVRNYMAAYAYGNAVTDDLWRELDKVADAPISDIAHDFTLQEGIPLIRVEESSRGAMLTQSRFALDESGERSLDWRVPIIAKQAAGGAPWRGVATRGDRVELPLDARDGVIVNAGQSGYYQTLYPQAAFAKLAGRFAALPAADQLGLVSSARMLGLSGDMPLSNLLVLAAQANAKLHPQVSAALADRLAGLDEAYDGLPTQGAYRTFARGVLRPIFASVGWKARRGEAPDMPLLRAALLSALSQLDDGAVIAEARTRFARNLNRLSAEERRTVLEIVARHADLAIWERLRALAARAPTNVEKERYYALLGTTVDKTLAERALALTLGAELAPTTRPNIVDTISREFPELAFDFAGVHRDTVMEWLEPTTRDQFVPDLLNTGQEERLIEKLDSYRQQYIPENARRASDVTAGQIKLNVTIRTKRLPEVDKWLAEHGS